MPSERRFRRGRRSRERRPRRYHNNNNYSVQKNKKPTRSQLNTVGSLVGTVAIYHTLIGSVIFILICIGVLIFAQTHNRHWVEIQAVVSGSIEENPTCHWHTNSNKHTSQVCSYKLNYSINGKEYQNVLSNVGIQDENFNAQGQRTITIDYNPKNHYDISTPFGGIRGVLTWIMVGLITLTLLTALFFYKFRKNKIVKGLATVQMASTILRRD